MKLSALLLTSLVVITFNSVTAKTWPKGTGVVTLVHDSALGQEPCWTDPHILFVVVRDYWSNVEPTDGTYDWSYFGNAKYLANLYNKDVVFSVNGAVYPQWLANEGVPIWTSSTGATAPYPWNSTLQSKWATFISAFGNKFDSFNHLIGVTMWAGGTGIESFFCRNSTDDANLDAIAGGGPGSGAAFWENAAKTLINDYFNSFPTTTVYLATGQNYVDSAASMTDLSNWFLNLYPNVNGLQSDALSPGYPDASGKFPHTNTNCNSIYIIMYQYVSPISGMGGGATNTTVLKNAYNHNGWAAQCYPQDPATDNDAGAIWFNSQFGL